MKVGSFISLFALLLLAGLSQQATAAIHTWPGSAPCNGTLQACINASANGDYISISTSESISEQLILEDRSLTLRAANGFHPKLTSGYDIFVFTSSAAGDLTVRIDGITVIDGEISMGYSGAGTATYELKNSKASKITVKAWSGTLNATVYNNRVVGLPDGGVNSGMLSLTSLFATLNAEVYFNHVISSSGSRVDGSGILIDERNGSSGKVKLSGNTVRGSFDRAGIYISEGLLATSASDFDAYAYSNVVICNASASSSGTGIVFVIKNGNMTAQAVNNTVSGCDQGVGVTRWSGGTATAVSGVVSNNVVVGAEYGLYLDQPLASSMTNDYNLINATHTANGGLTLGSHTITSPANLVSPKLPRLSSVSPGIDAGDTTTLGFGLIFNGLPVLDADGLRRIKGPGPTKVDIGAYEYGDLSFMHTVSASNVGHISTITSPITDGDRSLDLFATPNFDAGGIAGPAASNNHAFGSWYSAGHWTLFLQDTSVQMPPNAHFNLFVPREGSGVFRHTATAADTTDWSTQLNDSSVNNKPDRIVLVNQNYTAGQQYNNHPVGVDYFAWGGSGFWYITNLDQLGSGGDMPIGAGFSVYAQEPSPNAFRVTQSGISSRLTLDHPLMNDTPCAQIAVTRMFGGGPAAGHFDLDYDPAIKRWEIYSYSPIAVGVQFNVVVNPAQVENCNMVELFADGFE